MNDVIIYVEKSIVSAKQLLGTKIIIYLGFQIKNQPIKTNIIFLHQK